MDNDRVFVVAKKVLNAVVNYYALNGIDLPTRAYVSNGLPAIDCEQVTVHCERTFSEAGNVALETIEAIPRAQHALRASAMMISIFRCVPVMDEGTGIAPSAAAIEASALEILSDPTIIANALLAADSAGTLGSDLLGIGDWTSVEPSGMFGGGYLRAFVGLTRV